MPQQQQTPGVLRSAASAPYDAINGILGLPVDAATGLINNVFLKNLGLRTIDEPYGGTKFLSRMSRESGLTVEPVTNAERYTNMAVQGLVTAGRPSLKDVRRIIPTAREAIEGGMTGLGAQAGMDVTEGTPISPFVGGIVGGMVGGGGVSAALGTANVAAEGARMARGLTGAGREQRDRLTVGRRLQEGVEGDEAQANIARAGELAQNYPGFNPTLAQQAGSDSLVANQITANAQMRDRELNAAGARYRGNELAARNAMSEAETQGPVQQEITDSIRSRVSGARGRLERQKTALAVRRDSQQKLMRADLNDLQRQIAGGHPLVEMGEGGASVSANLAAQEAASNKMVNEAYQTARNQPGRASRQELAPRIAQVRRDVTDEFSLDPNNAPGVGALLDELEGDVRAFLPPRNTPWGKTNPQPAPPIDVGKLFAWRQKATRLASTTSNDVSAAAARRAISSFDREIDDLIDQGLLEGGQEAIETWKRAIAMRRAHGARFQNGDIVEKLTERQEGRRTARLVVAPEQAANYLLGASSSSLATKTQMVEELRLLQKILPPGEWSAIKQEVFLRLRKAADGGFSNGERMVNADGFDRAWANMRRDNPELVKTLFSDSERNAITNFKRFGKERDAIKAREMTLVSRQRQIDETALARLLRGIDARGLSPQDVVANAIRDPNELKRVVAVAKRTGSVLALQREVWNQLAPRNAAELKEILSNPNNRRLLGTFFTQGHLNTLDDVADMLSINARTPPPRGTGAQAASQEMNAGDMAGMAASIARGGVPLSMIGRLLVKEPPGRQQQIMRAALADQQFANELMVLAKTSIPERTFAQRWNALKIRAEVRAGEIAERATLLTSINEPEQ